jgi:uncharacterized protein DUF4238
MMAILRNRKDHYIPRSYLRGFIDPSRSGLERPLWHFDVPNGIWSERSAAEVGYRHGFYDYATSGTSAQSADSTFEELERRYPKVRSSMLEQRFANWRQHLEFLLRYAQMMRARSLLFFESLQAQWSTTKVWVVEEAMPDKNAVRLKSMTPEGVSLAFIRNRVISQMREEINKGPAWLNEFSWCVRHCDSSSKPFIISEIPFVCHGKSTNLEEALLDPETLLLFPLCWQACLVGRRQHIEDELGSFGEADMHRIRKIYRDSADLFLLSSTKLEF